jgi:hypothetical protein
MGPEDSSETLSDRELPSMLSRPQAGSWALTTSSWRLDRFAGKIRGIPVVLAPNAAYIPSS